MSSIKMQNSATQTNPQSLSMQQPKQLSDLEPTTKVNKLLLRKWLSKVWQFLIVLMTKQPEMRIWQSCDRTGMTWWNVYNPATGQSARLSSAEELLAWIDQSYYRK